MVRQETGHKCLGTLAKVWQNELENKEISKKCDTSAREGC